MARIFRSGLLFFFFPAYGLCVAGHIVPLIGGLWGPHVSIAGRANAGKFVLTLLVFA